VTATVTLIAWAFAIAAMWIAYTVPERRARRARRARRWWCAACQHHVPGDLLDHLATEHPERGAWCWTCVRSVPVEDIRAHKALAHADRPVGVEDTEEWAS